MLNKLGLQKYLLVIVSIVILISFLSSLFTVSYSQKSLDELLKSSQNIAAISIGIIDLSIDMSSIQSSLSPLITEKDPDLLEAGIAKIESKIKEVQIQLDNCLFDCKEVNNIYATYKLKISDLIQNRILLGKTAESIEFFIQDVSPLYLQNLVELEKEGNLIKNKTLEFSNKSKEQALQLKYAIMASSLLMIIMISIGGLSFRSSLVKVLNQISKELNENVHSMRNTSDNVASTSDFLSQSSTEQNATIQATSQAVLEISQMTDTNRNNVLVSTQNAKVSQLKITEGKVAISNMLESIQQISKSNNKMVEQIGRNDSEFSEVIGLIKSIDDKTKVINDIVFQTKLLSFNASVEAARAGEQGKGFSVVSEEIGNLAIMSGNAASEISSLLNSSIKRVNEIVKYSQTSMVDIVQDGKNTIIEGNKNANNCDVLFDQISLESQSICNILEEINAGTQEQSKGIEEVNKSMLELNTVANKSELVAQDSQQMSLKLNEQSESLKHIVEEMLIIVNGKKA